MPTGHQKMAIVLCDAYGQTWAGMGRPPINDLLCGQFGLNRHRQGPLRVRELNRSHGRALRQRTGSPRARPICCRCRTITWCSRCRRPSPTSPTRTRPWSTIFCSRSRTHFIRGTQIPIAQAAPPTSPSRGFLPWRFADVGPVRAAPPSWGRHPKTFPRAALSRTAPRRNCADGGFVGHLCRVQGISGIHEA